MKSFPLILLILFSCRNERDNNSPNSTEFIYAEFNTIEYNKLKLLKSNLTHFIIKSVLEDSLNGIMKNDQYLLEVEDITKVNLPIDLYGDDQSLDKYIRDSLFSIVYGERSFSNSILLNTDLRLIRTESLNYREIKKIKIFYKRIEKDYVDIVLNVFIDLEWSSIEYLKIKHENFLNFTIVARKTISIS
jgi:hypothetical protein